MKGKLFIISGPSGVGKDTICDEILKRNPDLHRPITYTTRSPRPSEKPGHHYHFVSQEEFKKMIKEKKLIEWAKVYGNYYGARKEDIEKALREGKIILFDIDVQGALHYKKIFPEAILIFLKAPLRDIESRIRKRGENKEGEIKKRLETAKREMRYEGEYDYSLLNPQGHPEKAVAELEKIIKSKDLREFP